MRNDGRRYDQLRPVTIERGIIKHAEGSAFIKVGDTHVICAATVEDKAPPFLKNTGQGWVTAEYSMLPRATTERNHRERKGLGGRTMEIQRLIGRSLRAVVEMGLLGERTITIDCDVIQADGGTRCASITGSYVALCDAVSWLMNKEKIARNAVKDHVAAVSVGMIKGLPSIDLNYKEDSSAEVDMNVVMTGAGLFVEVQGTAESKPFGQEDMDKMLNLARKGVFELFETQKTALGTRA
ncbi:MAG: ribonuclease PH [Nitrospinae bacterium]|nr:ribonuclease PH [Nitrospinota bacterium]